MSNNVVPLNPQGAVVGPQNISNALKAALEHPMIGVTGNHGYELRPCTWCPPALITPELANEARARLAWVEANKLRTAESQSIADWLLALGNAVASSSAMTQDEVRAKVSAMLTIIEDYPAGCFTRATLKRCGKAFKFFPSASELSRELDDEASAIRVECDRLRRIADGVASGPKEHDERPTGPRSLSEASMEALARMRLSTDGPSTIARTRA